MEIKISLDYPSYEEDISRAIYDEIMRQVQDEVRLRSKPLRKAIAEAMLKDQQKLINMAMSSMKKTRES